MGTFRKYVQGLMSDTVQLLRNIGKASDQDEPFSRCGGDKGGPHQKTKTGQLSEDWRDWKHFQLARPNRNSKCDWIDKENVCNTTRLRVLVSELRKSGFECNVAHCENYI